MAKSMESLAADLIRAVLDFIYQSEFDGIMPAVYRMIRAVSPGITEQALKSETLGLLESEIMNAHKWTKDSFITLMATLKEGGAIEFSHKTVFAIVNSVEVGSGPGEKKWFDDRDTSPFLKREVAIYKDTMSRFMANYTSDAEKEKPAEMVSVPLIIIKTLEALRLFPLECLKVCAECDNFFFDNRGYKRRFCSKTCSTRFTVRESRARKARERKNGDSR